MVLMWLYGLVLFRHVCDCVLLNVWCVFLSSICPANSKTGMCPYVKLINKYQATFPKNKFSSSPVSALKSPIWQNTFPDCSTPFPQYNVDEINPKACAVPGGRLFHSRWHSGWGAFGSTLCWGKGGCICKTLNDGRF